MEFTSSAFSLQLCALSRVNTDGYKAVALSVGYGSSNLGSVFHGRRKMPADIAEKISQALAFNSTGFTNSGLIESAIARDVQSVLDLVENGFDVKLICRLRSDRERKYPDKVLYKFALLQVSFNNTHRFLVLRMTRDGIDQLWTKRSLKASSANSNQKDFDYDKLNELMRLKLTASEKFLRNNQTALSTEQVTELVDVIYQIVESGDGSAHMRISREATQLKHADRTRRHRQYVSIVKSIYGLSSGREPFKSTGRTKLHESVPVEIHPIFREDSDEQVRIATSDLEQLIILQEHVQNVIEIIYEGPRHLITGINEAGPKSKNLTLKPAEFREYNVKVRDNSRLIKPTSTSRKAVIPT